MTDYTIELQNVTQIFGRRLIFKEINYTFESGKVTGLAGRNGSGKSTLAKIISGIISPTKGKVLHRSEGKTIEDEKLHNHIGFVSPYLVLYDEFTAEENLVHFSKIRGTAYDSERSLALFERFGLADRRGDLLKGFSSGMKQRVKFIFAMLHDPQMLLLDEPTSNLDTQGKDTVYDIIREEAANKAVIVASNEETDLALCNGTLEIEKYRRLD